MSSQPIVVAQTVVTGACVVWVVWGYVVGGTLVSGTTQQCTINTKNTVLAIHNTDTVAYTTHSGSYSTERKTEVHRYTYTRGTQQL